MDAATVGDRVAGLLFAIAVVEPLGNDPQCRTSNCQTADWRLQTARFAVFLGVQTTVTRCDNVTCRCLSRPTPGDTHCNCQASHGRPPHPVSCLLSKNPAHQRHSTCRLSEQADGTTISSLSPALSHHHMHGSSPRNAFPIMIHPRAITNLRFRRLPHPGSREPTVVRWPAVQCPVAPQLHQLHTSLLRRHQNQRHFRYWVTFPETLLSHVSRLQPSPALLRSWDGGSATTTPPRNTPISLSYWNLRTYCSSFLLACCLTDHTYVMLALAF